MELTLCYYAALKERAGCAREQVCELPSELTIAELKSELERRRPELGSLTHVRAVLGTRYVAEDTRISNGQEVHLLPPVSGGSGEPAEGLGNSDSLAAGRFFLSAQPLDPAACSSQVGDPDCGGLCLFVGTVRNHNLGRRVSHIDYEAFEAMAEPEMARIFEECRGRFDPERQPQTRLRMLVGHRTGRVAVGQPAVVVVVSSPHRELAFAACRFLIDTLKARLPIWKHEFADDGQHWIADRP